MIIHVPIHERVVLHLNGRPVRWLRPGRHVVIRPFTKVQLTRLNVDELTANVRPEQAALAPTDELEQLMVQTHERAALSIGGKPIKWLGPGRHFVFRVDPTLRVQVLDTRGGPTAPLDPMLRKIVPASDYLETQVAEGTVALR